MLTRDRVLLERWPKCVCMWKPCICNVSRPLYVSVRYLENASFFGPCVCRVWPWLFFVVSRHGMSEEEAPASAYLRAVSKSVAGFVYTERGKSTKNTVNSIAPWHIHNNTYLHVHTHAQTHTHNGHTALCKSTTTDMETYAQTSSAVIYQNSNVEQHFCGIFFSA